MGLTKHSKEFLKEQKAKREFSKIKTINLRVMELERLVEFLLKEVAKK